MLLKTLREEVLDANIELVRRGLVIYTFGNVSGFARDQALVAIKPSGVPYDELKPESIVVTALDGNIVDGNLRPSSDLATHIEIYKAFPGVGGVAHTHSPSATAWAQAGKPIPCFGTTHADYYYGPVPVTEPLTPDEISGEYEKNTGVVIRRTFERVDPQAMPAVLVAGHAPFCWGKNASDAAHNAVILEYVARMALDTLSANPHAQPISQHLLDKHYLRKHGRNAYYGQATAKSHF